MNAYVDPESRPKWDKNTLQDVGDIVGDPADTGRNRYDFEFPLFNREMSIEEFERLLVNNPQNEYLKQSVVEDRHSDLNSLISSAESRCEEVNRYKDMKTPVHLEK